MMGARAFFESCKRLLRLATRPSRRELTLSIRISVLGITAIGFIGFIIRFIAAMTQGFAPP